MKNLEEHRKAVEAAGTARAEARAALSRDNRPLFSPEEQARREAEAEATFRNTFTDAAASAVAAIADAEAELAALDRREADPVGALIADDLTKANARAGFVKEDAEVLPLAALADRCEDAGRGGDRASMALFLRYGQRRLEAEQGKRGYSDDTARLEAALNTLRARLFNHGDKRDALVARRDAAQQLQSHAASVRYIQQRYGGR